MAQLQRIADMAAGAQTETETEPKAKTREKMDLSAYLVALHDQQGNEVGKGFVLDSPSHLAATDEHKETFGGLLKGFVDPQTRKPCTFISKTTGEVIEGGLPVRFFDEDAEALVDHLGMAPAKAQLHLLITDASASIYRKEDGSVAYAVFRLNQIGGAAWRAPKLLHF